MSAPIKDCGMDGVDIPASFLAMQAWRFVARLRNVVERGKLSNKQPSQYVYSFSGLQPNEVRSLRAAVKITRFGVLSPDESSV